MAKLKDGFYKQTAESIGSDLYVLLAGGGSKPLSDFATASDSPTLTDYYWADQKITSTASFVTTPTVSSITATSLFYLKSDDATLKIYPIAGLNSSNYGNEAIAMQTCFDGKDPSSSNYVTDYSTRTVLSLQPRGGRVGIGTNIPQAKLDIVGDVKMLGEVISLAADVSGENTNADSPKLWLGAMHYSLGWYTGSYIQALRDGGYGNHTLSFFTKESNDYSTAPVERMRITKSGNVLIGTTNSAYKFRVAGNGAFNNEICVYDADDIYRLTCYEYQGIGRIYSYNETDDVFGDLWLGNNNGDVITVKASGNVGIGTTDPQAKLHINTTLQVGQILNSSNTENGIRFDTNNSSKGWVGWSDTYGTSLYNYSGSHYFGMLPSGTPHYDGANLRAYIFGCAQDRYIAASTDLNTLTNYSGGWWGALDNTTYTNGPGYQNFGLLAIRLNTGYWGQIALPYSSVSQPIRYRSQIWSSSGNIWQPWQSIMMEKYGSSVCGTEAAWSVLASWSTGQSTELGTDVTLYLHSSFSNRYGYLHIRVRRGEYLQARLLWSVNVDVSKIRVYYSSNYDNIQVAYLGGESYSQITAELVADSDRSGSHNNRVTCYRSYTAPSYTSYITPTYDTLQQNISGSSDKLGGVSSSNYRRLDITQMFGSEVASNYYIGRCKENGGGWAYAPYVVYKGDKSTLLSSIGVYGTNNTLTYSYFGSNNWDGANLRVYRGGNIYCVGAEINGDIAFSSSHSIGTCYSSSDSTKYNKITIHSATNGIMYDSGSWTSGDHQAHTFRVGTSNTEALVIRNNGRVGIGTNAPENHLHVNGDVLIKNSSGNRILNLTGNQSSLRLFAWGDATYIESGNSDFSANKPLKITGIGGSSGSDLYLTFSNIYTRGGTYVNIDSGNIGSYAITSLPSFTVRNSTTVGKFYLQKDGVDISNCTIKLPTSLPANGGNADTVDNQHASRFAWIYNSSDYNSNKGLTLNQMAADANSNAHMGMIYSGTDNPVSSSGSWLHVWSQTWNSGVSSSWVSQIALGVEAGTGMWYRTTSGSIVGRGWNRVVDSANVSSYALLHRGWWSSDKTYSADGIATGMYFAYANHGVPNHWGTLVTFAYQENSSYNLQLHGTGDNYLYYRNRSADYGQKPWKRLADASDIPTKVSQLTNDSGFVTRNVNTSTNTNPFIVSRSGSTVEALKIGVDDNIVHFVHEQDETVSDFLFKGKWNDTESGGGKSAGEKTIRFGLNSSDHNIYVGSSTVLHSGNYTSYTVKKDGTGASGTWGINISGNAATVDGVHLEWSGSQAAADTTWLAGWTSDGTKLKAVKRADLSVNYATSAGSAEYLHGTTPQLCAASESDNITIVANSNSAITTNSPTNLAAIRKAIDFKWYNTHWQIGNIRNGSSDSAGFGITYGGTNLRFRVTTDACYVGSNVVIHSGNIGSQSVSYASSAGNADTVDGYHVATAGNTKPWSRIVSIGSDGVSEMGRYIDFHYDNTTGSDYSTRLQCGGNHSNTVTLPSSSGTLALTSQIPTNTWRGITDSYSGTDSTISLSQKGGNALYNALVNGYASSAGTASYVTVNSSTANSSYRLLWHSGNTIYGTGTAGSSGSIYCNPANAYIYANAFYQNSDRILKTNIQNLSKDLLDRVYNINEVSFNWKESGREAFGYIAQDYEAISKTFVDRQDDGTLTLDYTKALVAQIAALKQKIVNLEERLHSLERS